MKKCLVLMLIKSPSANYFTYDLIIYDIQMYVLVAVCEIKFELQEN